MDPVIELINQYWPAVPSFLIGVYLGTKQWFRSKSAEEQAEILNDCQSILENGIDKNDFPAIVDIFKVHVLKLPKLNQVQFRQIEQAMVDNPDIPLQQEDLED